MQRTIHKSNFSTHNQPRLVHSIYSTQDIDGFQPYWQHHLVPFSIDRLLDYATAGCSNMFIQFITMMNTRNNTMLVNSINTCALSVKILITRTMEPVAYHQLLLTYYCIITIYITISLGQPLSYFTGEGLSQKQKQKQTPLFSPLFSPFSNNY